MIRYIAYSILYIIFQTLAVLLAPILVLLARDREGPLDNNNLYGSEPRLPRWLSWFDTPDNSLWGDHGWRTKHTPEYWKYSSKVRWLWRNPASGFCWKVLSIEVDLDKGIDYIGDIGLDKGFYEYVKVTTVHKSLFQIRSNKKLGSLRLFYDIGWLLIPCIKESLRGPYRAKFVFGPKLPKVV